MKVARLRVQYFRRYRKMLQALESLKDSKILSEELYRQAVRQLEKLYADWRQALIAKQMQVAQKRGRPRERIQSPECKRPGCSKPARNGYCSADCAPLSHYFHGTASYAKPRV